MVLIRSEVNESTYLIEGGGWGKNRDKEGGVYLSEKLKGGGGHVSPPIISDLSGCRQKSN